MTSAGSSLLRAGERCAVWTLGEEARYIAAVKAHNEWCGRVGVSVPRVEDVAARRTAKLFHLMIVALLDTLHALGLDATRFRVVDLKPPKKSKQLNRAGRTLSITPELLIAGTTGISRPFGEPQKVAQYLAEGDRAKLGRRLESDIKALFAFYQYGVLHGSVRLRWGFLDEQLGTEWALPGDPSLYPQLKAAAASGSAVDLVLGAAQGFADPWSRARRVFVVGVRFGDVLIAESQGQMGLSIDRDEIQAIRLAEEG